MLTLLAIVAPNFASLQTRIRGWSVYNTQSVLCQLGCDLGTVWTSGHVSYSNALLVENKFVAGGRMEILAGAERIFCSVWAVKVWCHQEGSYLFRVNCDKVVDGFMLEKEESLLELVMSVPTKLETISWGKEEDRPHTELRGRETKSPPHNRRGGLAPKKKDLPQKGRKQVLIR